MGRKRVSLDDAAWLHMDSAANQMVVATMVRLGGVVEHDVVASLVEQRLIGTFPRLTARIVTLPSMRLPAPQRHWEDDPTFRLEHHLQCHRADDDDALRAVLGAQASVPFDRSRPRWRLHVIDTPQGTVLHLRTHHALADGLALVQLFQTLADPPPGGGRHPGQMPLAEAARRPQYRIPGPTQLVDGARVYRKLGRLADQRNPLRGRPTGTKHLRWSSPVALTDAKTVAAASEATVNDLALAVIAGALRRYLEPGGTVPDRIGITVPYNLRPLDAPLHRQLGNQVGLVFVNLPVAMADPAERVAHLRQRTAAIKASPEGEIVRTGMAMVGAINQRPMARAWMQVFTRKSTAIVTNIAGPPSPLTFGGVPVDDFMLWVPTSGSVGIGLSIVTYAGALRFGIQVDDGVVGEPDRLSAALDAELGELDRYRPA